MKKLLLPMVFIVAGVGTGVGGGLFLRPDAVAGDEHAPADDSPDGDDHAAPAADAHGDTGDHAEEDSDTASASHAEPSSSRGGSGEAASGGHADDGHGGGGGEQYVKLGNQFIVPILEDSRVRSLVVLSIDLEVGPAGASTVYRVEPKIRDAFLTVLFDHANAGGFDGTFTSSGSMEILRRSLREAGRKAVGDNVVTDVLITGIVRQDV